MSDPANFLDIPEEFSRYAEAASAILPVPYEATVSYGGGTAAAPAAIIAASSQVELYDDELRSEPFKGGIATLKPLAVEGLAPARMAAKVEEAVARIISDGKLLLLLGGEHSITPPAVRAVHGASGPITVVQLDAHADLRQEYQGEPLSHACAMARVREICPAVQIGIRSISKEEAEWAGRERFPIFHAGAMRGDDRWMEDAIRAVATERAYVSIDVDVFDSSLLPATGTPEPGGLDWHQVTRFLRRLAAERDVVAYDIVELSPIQGIRAYDFMVARLAYKCIAFSAASRRISSRGNLWPRPAL